MTIAFESACYLERLFQGDKYAKQVQPEVILHNCAGKLKSLFYIHGPISLGVLVDHMHVQSILTSDGRKYPKAR